MTSKKKIYMYDMAECSTKYRTEDYTDKLEIVSANRQRQCISDGKK